MRRHSPGLVLLTVLFVAAGCAKHANRASSAPSSSTSASATSAPAGSVTSSAAPTTAPANCLASSGDLPAHQPETAVPALTDVQVVSDHEAWAVGSRQILHTADGGRTWTRQYAGPAEITGVDFVDAQHGWAVTTTTVLATDNGGQCWTERAPGLSRIWSVHFVNPSTGWAVAGDDASPASLVSSVPTAGAYLVRTADGGRTWTRQTTPQPDVQSVCFSDASSGWLATATSLQRTSDGGKTWQAVDLPTTDSAGWFHREVQCAPGGAWVQASGQGATGHISHALYQVASSGGAAGRAVLAESFTHPADAPPTPGTFPGPISVLSASSVVDVDYTPALDPGKSTKLALVQPDGTITRPDPAVPEMEQPQGASFASAQVGWVVGTTPGTAGGPGPGLIAATTDGGKTWTVQFRTT